MAAPRAKTPRLYFNLRSPYSWLALHDLTTQHPELAPVIEWRPCWEPDSTTESRLIEAGGRSLYTPMSPQKHLYTLMDVRRLARQRDLRVRWPVDRAPRWELPHLAYFIAAGSGVGVDYAVAVSRARWERGRDITDPDVVAEIGAGLGLDGTRLATADQDPAAVRAGTASLLGMCRDSVFGFPFFVHGREKFWGVDRLEGFVASVRSSVGSGGSHHDPPAPSVAMAMTDDGHAGGCG